MSLDIAIVGISCRFPGAHSPRAFWDLLSEGRSSITEVPPSRWDTGLFYDPDPTVPGKANTKWGGFLANPGGCDIGFFNLTAEEAVHVDPQQRMVLELGWEALEDAGIAPDTLKGTSVGVYVGISHNDYERIIYQRPERITQFHGTGSYQSVAAARLSYFLNLTGPSMVIDTACSSALSALHVAGAALRQGRMPLALVGAVTLHLTPDETIGLTKGRMLSGDGICKSFDKNADGYVRGEGGGVMVLKRLEDAVCSGDRILGVVRGTAVNHNGRSNGLSSPSGLALKRVMEECLASAQVDPREVTMLEAHGTGTKWGDQIELRAIREVYEKPSTEALWLGSCKTNIGHLETASGMASLTKVLLAMEHRAIPPNLHFTGDSRPADVASRLHVPLTLEPWHTQRALPLAAITAYGFGGANAHALVEAALPAPPLDERAGPQLLCLSARSEEALRELARSYVELLGRSGPQPALADVCYTAAVGRSHFEWRAAFVALEDASMRKALQEALAAPTLGQRAARAGQPEATDGRDLSHEALGALYERGAKIDWVTWYAGKGPHRKVSLPTYPFQRRPYWRSFQQDPPPSYRLAGALGELVCQHRLYDVPVAPGALHLALCHAALQSRIGSEWLGLEEVRFIAPLVIQADADVADHVLHVEWQPASNGMLVQSGKAALHLDAKVLPNAGYPSEWDAGMSVGDARATDGAALYEAQAARGIGLGPLLRWIVTVEHAGAEASATLEAPEGVAQDGSLALHPGLIDSCFHVLRSLLDGSGTWIPVAIDRVLFKRDIRVGQRSFRCRAVLDSTGTRGHLHLYANEGLVMVVEGLRAGRVDAQMIVRRAQAAEATVFAWKPAPLPMAIAAIEAPVTWLVISGDLQVAAIAELQHAASATDLLWVLQPWAGNIPQAIAAHVEVCLAVARELAANNRLALRVHFLSHSDDTVSRLAYETLEALTRAVCAEVPGVRMFSWCAPSTMHLEEVQAVVSRIARETRSAVINSAGRAMARRLATLTAQAQGAAPALRGTACLVTGAGGALGQLLCRHLADRGVARLYVSGRRTPDLTALRGYLRDRRLVCELVPCELDVSDREQVRTLIGCLQGEGPTLRGIFHLAGTLRDASALHVGRDVINAVFAPKVAGTWHLHEATAHLPLEAFVCYSSVTSVLTSPGQGVYSAANAFLNGLCALRRSRGMAGQSVCWGPWQGEGMASGLSDATRRGMQALGVEPLRPAAALAALDIAMGRPGVDVLILACSRPEAVEAAAHEGMRPLRPPAPPAPGEAKAATSVTEESVTALAVDVMELGEMTLEPTLPLERLGLDSLMGVDLVERINDTYCVDLPLTTRALEMSVRDLVQAVRNAAGVAPASLLSGGTSPQATHRLLGLYYLGGDPTCFAGWPAQLGTEVDFRTFDWRAAGSRDMGELADLIAKELATLPPLPLHLYGHSMGSLLAYEVARRLETTPCILRGLAVGAMWAPDMHREAMQQGPSSVDMLMYHLHESGGDADALLRRTHWRQSAEADWSMMRNYRPVDTPPLRCDISAIAGARDTLVAAEKVEGWRRLCVGDFQYHRLPGGHFFLHDADNVPSLLRDWMTR